MMTKLLRAVLRRYFKSLAFWLILGSTVANGLLSGSLLNSEGTLEDAFLAAEFVLFAVLISLSVGREYSDGGFRNKLIAGHTKGKVFVSEYIAALCLCFAMYLLWCCAVAVMNSDSVMRIMGELLCYTAVGFIALGLCMISVIFAVCILIPRRAVTSVVGILLVLCLSGAAYMIKYELNHSETTVEYLYDESGRPIGPSDAVPNPKYVGGVQRDVYVFLNGINPFGAMLEYKGEVYPFFRRNAYMMSQTVLDIELSETVTDKFTALPIYQLGTALVFVSAGFFLFRKKDFN